MRNLRHTGRKNLLALSVVLAEQSRQADFKILQGKSFIAKRTCWYARHITPAHRRLGEEQKPYAI